MKRRLISAILAVAMVATMAVGCGSKESSGSEDRTVTLKVFSNLPDRKNGQGLVEQMIIDEYMEENENVKIEVEALDEEAYKTKFKAYSMEGMPDVVSIWGQPSFLDEVVDAGVLAELNADDYADYKFIEGSLNGFTYDGKLYGLPRNTDVACIYYNEKMFKDNGWEVPTTYDELLALAEKINAAGIVADAVANGDFTDESMKKATEFLKEAADAKLFQSGYDSQDYGTAMNLFTNGQAAMFYMGSWESSMALNEDIPEEIRTNSEVKEEAIKFLNYMYQPDKLSKYGWENGASQTKGY